MGCGAAPGHTHDTVAAHAANVDVIDDTLVKHLWDDYDGKVNSDGSLCQSELAYLLNDYAAEKRKAMKGQKNCIINDFTAMVELGKNRDKYAEMMFKKMDRNKDGSITFKEFQSKFEPTLTEITKSITKRVSTGMIK